MPAPVAGIHVFRSSPRTWMAGTSPAMTENGPLNPFEHLLDHHRDPARGAEHLVHDRKMVGVRNLLVAHGQSASRTVTREIGRLLAQQWQLGSSDGQRQRLHG